MSTWWMDCKNIKKKIFSRWLFEIIHIIRFEIWDLWSRDLKKILGYDINYLSIWPFMGHPWFPTRKASKLTFVKTDNVDYLKKPPWKKFFFDIFLAAFQRDKLIRHSSTTAYSSYPSYGQPWINYSRCDQIRNWKIFRRRANPELLAAEFLGHTTA